MIENDYAVKLDEYFTQTLYFCKERGNLTASLGSAVPTVINCPGAGWRKAVSRLYAPLLCILNEKIDCIDWF